MDMQVAQLIHMVGIHANGEVPMITKFSKTKCLHLKDALNVVLFRLVDGHLQPKMVVSRQGEPLGSICHGDLVRTVCSSLLHLHEQNRTDDHQQE